MSRQMETLITDLMRRNGELRDELERLDPDNKYLHLPTVGNTLRYNLIENVIMAAIGFTEGSEPIEDLNVALSRLEGYWVNVWRIQSERSKSALEGLRWNKDVDH